MDYCKTALFFGVMLLSLPLLADPFYLAPTPRGFNPEEIFETDTQRHFDSENESDELAYLRVPCHFQYVIRADENFFCGAVGSIGSKRFLTDMDFTFAHEFSDNVRARYHGVRKQDFSTNTEAQMIELLYKVGSFQSFGIHGQLEGEKDQNDAGASYNLHIKNLWARFEVTAFDFDRNKRNEQGDLFNQKPYAFTASFLKRSHLGLVYLNTHIEPQWIWRGASQGGEIKRIRHWVEGFALTELGYFAVESRQSLTDNDQAYLDEKFLRLHFEKRWKNWLFGTRWARRSWQNQDENVMQTDLVPFVWYRSPLLPEFDFGYDLTWHRAHSLENRMNVAWNIFEKKSGFFRLLFTFDLDEFGTEQTWEGGSGQLAFTF